MIIYLFMKRFWLSYNLQLLFACMLSCLSHVRLFETPRTTGNLAPLSKGFSRQEYLSGLPFLTSRDLPNPGIKPASLMSPVLGGRYFTTEPLWEALMPFTSQLISLSPWSLIQQFCLFLATLWGMWDLSFRTRG